MEWENFLKIPIKKQKKKFYPPSGQNKKIWRKMGKNEKVVRTRWAKFRSHRFPLLVFQRITILIFKVLYEKKA